MSNECQNHYTFFFTLSKASIPRCSIPSKSVTSSSNYLWQASAKRRAISQNIPAPAILNLLRVLRSILSFMSTQSSILLWFCTLPCETTVAARLGSYVGVMLFSIHKFEYLKIRDQNPESVPGSTNKSAHDFGAENDNRV